MLDKHINPQRKRQNPTVQLQVGGRGGGPGPAPLDHPVDRAQV